MKTRQKTQPIKKRKQPKKKKSIIRNLPPIQQPGGPVLSTIQGFTHRWTRGEIYSDEALCEIANIVAHNEFFEGLLEAAGWSRNG